MLTAYQIGISASAALSGITMSMAVRYIGDNAVPKQAERPAGVAVAASQSAPGQRAGHHQGGLRQDAAGGDAEAAQVSYQAATLLGSGLQ